MRRPTPAALIADRLRDLVLDPDPIDTAVQTLFVGLQTGTLDRSRLAPNLNAYFDARTLEDFSTSLGPLGSPKRFERRSASRRGGMEFRTYRAYLADRCVTVSVYLLPNGRLEQFLVAPAN